MAAVVSASDADALGIEIDVKSVDGCEAGGVG